MYAGLLHSRRTDEASSPPVKSAWCDFRYVEPREPAYTSLRTQARHCRAQLYPMCAMGGFGSGATRGVRSDSRSNLSCRSTFSSFCCCALVLTPVCSRACSSVLRSRPNIFRLRWRVPSSVRTYNREGGAASRRGSGMAARTRQGKRAGRRHASRRSSSISVGRGPCPTFTHGRVRG